MERGGLVTKVRKAERRQHICDMKKQLFKHHFL